MQCNHSNDSIHMYLLYIAWGGLSEDYIMYYSSCSQGHQHLWDYIPDIVDSCQLTIDAIDAASGTTASETAIYTPMKFALQNVIGNATAAVDATNIEFCREMQAAWFQIFNDGVCGDVYEGVRNGWIAQVSSAVLLFFIVIVGSCVSKQFTTEAQVLGITESDIEKRAAEMREEEYAVAAEQAEADI